MTPIMSTQVEGEGAMSDLVEPITITFTAINQVRYLWTPSNPATLGSVLRLVQWTPSNPATTLTTFQTLFCVPLSRAQTRTSPAPSLIFKWEHSPLKES